MGDGWFTRYGTGPHNTGQRTTLWEFSIDGLTEEQAVELDRQIRQVVEAFEAAVTDGADDRG